MIKIFALTKEGKEIKKHIENYHCLTCNKLEKLDNNRFGFWNNKKYFIYDKEKNIIY